MPGNTGTGRREQEYQPSAYRKGTHDSAPGKRMRGRIRYPIRKDRHPPYVPADHLPLYLAHFLLLPKLNTESGPFPDL